MVFIASADQAHRHKKSGPYGYRKAAKEYDTLVLHAIQKGRIDSIMRLKPKLVEDARPDSLWQMTKLVGVIYKGKMRPEEISYHVPTYFGMICASFRRNI